jgi:hypothetical protein
MLMVQALVPNAAVGRLDVSVAPGLPRWDEVQAGAFAGPVRHRGRQDRNPRRGWFLAPSRSHARSPAGGAQPPAGAPDSDVSLRDLLECDLVQLGIGQHPLERGVLALQTLKPLGERRREVDPTPLASRAGEAGHAPGRAAASRASGERSRRSVSSGRPEPVGRVRGGSSWLAGFRWGPPPRPSRAAGGSVLTILFFVWLVSVSLVRSRPMRLSVEEPPSGAETSSPAPG